MLTVRANRNHTAERGQVMPIFALVIGIIILFSSLLIDGTFAFQTYRDLDTIAYHAARAGATAINRSCDADPGANCPLNKTVATAQARAWANSWAAQDGMVLQTVSITFPTADTIAVHLRTCYAFKIPLPAVGSGACPGRWQLDSTQTARSLVGP